MRPSLLGVVPTDDSWFGISAGLAKSKLLKMQQMGHRSCFSSMISEFARNQVEDWVIASVAEDNILQVWLMAENIYHDDDDDDAEKPGVA